MVYSLDGKVFLLTGASGGIGAEIARLLVKEGTKVALLARRKEELDRLSDELNKTQNCALAIPADITDDESVKIAVSRAIEHFGTLDGLINNAGITMEAPVSKTSIEDYRRIMEVNFFGPLRMLHATIEHIKKNKGWIVTISSMLALGPFPNLSAYTSSKFALTGMAHCLRQELRGTGVKCVIVFPTLVATPMIDLEPTLARVSAQNPKKTAKAIINAIKRGKARAGTAGYTWGLAYISAFSAPIADEIVNLFVPPHLRGIG